MSYTYDSSVPDAANRPSDDQPIMQTNAASISNLIIRDHFGFNNSNAGYHNVIHQLVSGAGSQQMTRSGSAATYTNNPSGIPNVNQIVGGLYTPATGGGTAQTQLFSLDGSGKINQLTGSLLTDTNTSDGWAWVGGILLQWGYVHSTATLASNSLTFLNRVPGAIEFPNNCFLVNTTLLVKNTATSSNIRTCQLVVYTNTVSANGFSWAYNFDTSGIVDGFYWFAIGN